MLFINIVIYFTLKKVHKKREIIKLTKKNITIIINFQSTISSIKEIELFYNKILSLQKSFNISIILSGHLLTNFETELNQLITKHKQIYFYSENNTLNNAQNYLKNIQTAIEKHNPDFIIFAMDNFQELYNILIKLTNRLTEEFDCIISSGFINKKTNIITAIFNYILRFFLFFPFRVFIEITDPLSNFKVFKINDKINNISLKKLNINNHYYHLAFFYKIIQNDARVIEIPLVSDKKIQKKHKLFELIKTIIYLRLTDYKTMQFIKFCLIGLIGLIINVIFLEYFTYSIITKNIATFFEFTSDITIIKILNINSAWAAAFAAELAIINNFVFNNLWTFNKTKIRGIGKTIKKFLMFNITSIGAIFIQFFFIGIAIIIFGNIPLVRQITLILIVLLLVVPYNWIMYNIVIWNKKEL